MYVLANNDRQINWASGNSRRCSAVCVHNLPGTHSREFVTRAHLIDGLVVPPIGQTGRNVFPI